MYVMLGNFHARVGSRSEEGDQWGKVRGTHGLAEANHASTELLSSLSINEATVCNTCFPKRDIHNTDLAAPQVKEVALYRLCNCTAGTLLEVSGCTCQVGRRMSHRSPAAPNQAEDGSAEDSSQQQQRRIRRYDVTKLCANNVKIRSYSRRKCAAESRKLGRSMEQ